jgi:hypothetical protein
VRLLTNLITGGPAIEAHDLKTAKWIEEMDKESLKDHLQKLTDSMEYLVPGPKIDADAVKACDDEYMRQATLYKNIIHCLLSNRRFRKVLEDLQKLSKREATAMLVQCIQENLSVLRIAYQEKLVVVAENRHKSQNYAIVYGFWEDDGFYRTRSSLKHPPTPFGRRCAIFSYILIAAQLELHGVRLAIEDVVKFAKEEFALFNRLDTNECRAFRTLLLEESLYNPALLVTGILSDLSWNTKLKKELSEQKKLVTQKIVDYRARTTEYDMPGNEGWVMIKPSKPESMLTIRYYHDVSEEQLNAAFP